MAFDRNRPFEVYILQTHKGQTWVYAFYTFAEFLASLPARASLFAGAPDWAHGKLVAVTTAVEGARAAVPGFYTGETTQLTRLPWPDVIPAGCEIRVTTLKADGNRSP